MTSRSRTQVVAVLILLASVLTLGAPAGARDGADRSGKSGCEVRGGLEVCFSSPPTRADDPTVLDRPTTLFDAAGPGDTLRVAMFRWDIQAPTAALLAAQRRGAVVYLVGDEDLRLNSRGRRLIERLEAQDTARRNVTICDGACLPWRAPGPFPDSQNVQHLKFYVTDIGGVQSFITSSANLEDRQYRQYNSLLKIDDTALAGFGTAYFTRLFEQSLSAGGQRWDDRRKVFESGSVTAAVYPSRSDLLLSTLRDLTCVRGAREVSAMFAVIQRADVRAELARLANDGCRVRVVTTRDTIENWLQAELPGGRLAGSAVRTTLTHDKMLVAHARFRGRPTRLVVTGTSNTTCGGLLYNDEVMLRVVDERWLHDQYLAHFDDAWAHSHQSRSRIMPVMRPCRR
ncbi:Phosphatidylserine/phosphatidylglycerophosphate/cardiolipin synthase [Nocardioides alpinus]|uniref:phospholipase D n=1 Tax=Nocardioides alpinus TaxID=748909 RepID=A0A1I0Y4S6_9ACTN|nr:phospholipase D-like domain-containing protein [Nocardioides alpinus]PKH39059.1 phosphatidylserine/phosphatidylglycerophosphate/cardiolipin synthase family protein [Nocardioides alpinus]SFB08174.1 Phosphatidylserine/phosphatidylglycerophosphate/cardiolipin synthase [Nocardioides alpinus]